MKKPTIMCKEMHLHDIILGLMQPQDLHIVLDIFLNQQPFDKQMLKTAIIHANLLYFSPWASTV
jgi:hypothetical protein